MNYATETSRVYTTVPQNDKAKYWIDLRLHAAMPDDTQQDRYNTHEKMESHTYVGVSKPSALDLIGAASSSGKHQGYANSKVKVESTPASKDARIVCLRFVLGIDCMLGGNKYP